MEGKQIHKLFLSGDCFKDFYSLDDEFPYTYPRLLQYLRDNNLERYIPS